MGQEREIVAIKGLIHTISLGRGPGEYQAISYAWSNTKSFGKIQVWDFKAGGRTEKKSKTLEIPEDVYNMLFHFLAVRTRTHGHHDGAKGFWPVRLHLWIDQICIYQRDHREKSIQVGMMDDIYRQAHNVLVWLGFPSADSDLALDFVTHFNWNYYLRLLGRPATVPEVQPVHPSCANPHDPKPWLALRSLLTRPWWSRTWTIQEAILHKDCIVLCGKVYAGFGGVAHIMAGFLHFAQDHAHATTCASCVPRDSFCGISSRMDRALPPDGKQNNGTRRIPHY